MAGPLSVAIAHGAVRSLLWHGVEVLRGIDYPVRNADWGTYPASTASEVMEDLGDRFTYNRQFFVDEGRFDGRFVCEGNADGTVKLSLRLTATRRAQVNRAGFVVLHPIAGVAGTSLRVTHSDGTSEDSHFPEFISPSQPIFDIVSMRQAANGVTAEIAFSGEVFEMEDQRNWSDASYKTYCRPLALPFPYEIAAGEVIEQTIAIQLSGGSTLTSASNEAALRIGPPTGRALPEVALALEAGWETNSPALAALRPASTLLRLDLTDPQWTMALPALLASVHGQLDLELVVTDDATGIADSLADLRTVLERFRVVPRSITPLPKAYLRSYQPDAGWPTGATPEAAIAAARHIFPDVAIGGGALTNFTELNRYRGGGLAGDFVTHGTTAIVHAADDVSVVQTLEALPQILASAESLAPDRPYRLGLVSIGMRSNPYGAAVADNPQALRLPMAMADPRLDGLFGAAFMVGTLAATSASRVERIAVAGPAGPLGLMAGNAVRPAWHTFAGLSRLGGHDRLSATAPPGIAAVAVGSPESSALIVANLGPDARQVDLGQPGHIVLLDSLQPDPDWLVHAPRMAADSLTLPAFAVGFISFGPRDFFGTKP